MILFLTLLRQHLRLTLNGKNHLIQWPGEARSRTRRQPTPFTEPTDPTVHSALLPCSISLPIYSVTKHHNKLLLFNNFPRQNSAYVLSGWVTAPPPVDGALCSVDGTLGPSYGPSLRGRQDSNFLGTRVPILLWCLHLLRLKIISRKMVRWELIWWHFYSLSIINHTFHEMISLLGI